MQYKNIKKLYLIILIDIFDVFIKITDNLI